METGIASSRTNGTFYPVLRYNNAPAALDWLAQAFGFERGLVVPGQAGAIAYGQMHFGDGLIMLSSARDSDPRLVSPQSLGATTVAIHTYVADVDAHFQRAAAAGAEIISPPANTEHGSRDYTARDLEGHVWSFSTYRP
jgi:uncharacterized glyoxalase superfamily protein PhnB